jgi:hypothetical protein
MSCGADITQCDTVQIIEPNDDLLVDTAGQTNDMDERGELPLVAGQINAVVIFDVPKLNAHYHFEYLYVDAMGDNHPGAVQVVAVVRAIEGFAVTFAGTPLNNLCVLHWRAVVTRQSTATIIDQDLNIQMPRDQHHDGQFHNPQRYQLRVQRTARGESHRASGRASHHTCSGLQKVPGQLSVGG